MKIDCCVVRDLLPLYVENMVSDQTAEQIKQHLAECPDCQNECDSFRDNSKLDILETPVPQSDVKPFKKIVRKLNRQMNSLAYGLIIFFICQAKYGKAGDAELADMIIDHVDPSADEKAKMDKELKIWAIVVAVAVVVALLLYIIPFIMA